MVKKEFTYRGKSLDELKLMSISEFIELIPSRPRRSIKREWTDQQKKVIAKVHKGKRTLETHCRDMIVLPEMVDMIIKIHNGKEFVPVTIQPEMIGLFFGELVMTRKKVEHHAPGIGATKSSASLSVK